MCFSQTASFTLGATLVAIGVACTAKTIKNNKSYLLLAIVPFLFGIQQFVEGLIWGSLNTGNESLANFYAYLYLFFAYYFWTAYSPAVTYCIEKNNDRKKILKILMITGQLIGAIIYLPILLHIIPVKVYVLHNSICYDTYQSNTLLWIYSILYIFNLIMPTFLSSNRRIKIFGILILISIFVTNVFYYETFTSVWCFFGAFLSIYIGYIVSKAPTIIDN